MFNTERGRRTTAKLREYLGQLLIVAVAYTFLCVLQRIDLFESKQGWAQVRDSMSCLLRSLGQARVSGVERFEAWEAHLLDAIMIRR